MDLVRRPAGEGDARRHRPVAAGMEAVDGQSGRPRGRAGGRRDVGHLDPHFGEAPRGVEVELAAADVGGVVDLEDDVGQVVLADDESVPGEAGAGGVEVGQLVGLQDAASLALAGVPDEVHRAAALDGSARMLAITSPKAESRREGVSCVLLVGSATTKTVSVAASQYSKRPS